MDENEVMKNGVAPERCLFLFVYINCTWHAIYHAAAHLQKSKYVCVKMFKLGCVLAKT